MNTSNDFLKSVLNSITDTLAVIDETGRIVYVNSIWQDFGLKNFCLIRSDDWIGLNYLNACKDKTDEDSIKVENGLKQVLNGEIETFYLEYPCHCVNEKRWFMMRITPLRVTGERRFVIIHQNITERKLAELEVVRLSTIDSLTNVFNRRYFDEVFNKEWRRCARANAPIAVAFVDVDHFKMVNDTYGHQIGDNYLLQIATVLKQHTRRAGDITARYGGEEFVLAFNDTDINHLRANLMSIKDDVVSLQLPNANSPTSSYVTISMGATIMYPSKHNTEADIIRHSDKLLYEAKNNGRNSIKLDVINN